MKEIISLEQYLMGRDKLFPEEYTEEIKNNAIELLKRVNALLEDLNISKGEVSSGFRPPSINKTVANSAKKSLHQLGKAVDLKDDKEQTLAKAILLRPDLLKKHQLWLEDPTSTIGKYTNWVHLDISTSRKDRPFRMFKP